MEQAASLAAFNFGSCRLSGEAVGRLDEEWHILSQMEARSEQIPCRIIQLTRGELEVARRLGKDESREIERIGNLGFALAQELQYPRFAHWIESLLDELLN